jgi:nitroimidazol reductase NimA-like FMN-containing flavoprotein (pyridoxamine 5'-phosphate oxidase superfamily)
MSDEEKQAFLADVHVGVLSLPREGRGPLTVPIWYDYEPGGELWFLTERTSQKGRLLSEGAHISLCAQTETPPYTYVTVEGPITALDRADVEKHLRPMARRYLGTEGGDGYVESTGGGESRDGSVLVRMRPSNWLAVDYGKDAG